MNVTTKEAQLAPADAAPVDGPLVARPAHRPRSQPADRAGPARARLAAVNSEQETWRNWEYDDQRRWFATLSGSPTRSRVTAEVEAGRVNKAIKRAATPPMTPTRVAGGRVLSTTASTALGVQGLGANPYVVFDTTAGTLQNWTGKTTSLQRSYGNIPIALCGTSRLLPRETTVYGAGNDSITEYTRVMVPSAARSSATSPRTHGLPAPPPHARLRSRADAFLASTSVDTNATLPNGQPNPNAGRPYFDNQQSIIDRFLPQDAVRLTPPRLRFRPEGACFAGTSSRASARLRTTSSTA